MSPQPYYCTSLECRERSVYEPDTLIAYYESQQDACSYCGQRGFLVPGALTHLIQPAEEGIIRGVDLEGRRTGVRWEFLCARSRRGYRAAPSSPQYPKSFTALPSASTCYDCLTEFARRRLTQGVQPCS